jgi:hypothetical protein
MYKFTPDIIPDTSGKSSVLCHTSKNNYMIMTVESIQDSGWDWKVKKYKIDWWAYCEDVEFMLFSEKERVKNGL